MKTITRICILAVALLFAGCEQQITTGTVIERGTMAAKDGRYTIYWMVIEQDCFLCGTKMKHANKELYESHTVGSYYNEFGT